MGLVRSKNTKPEWWCGGSCMGWGFGIACTCALCRTATELLRLIAQALPEWQATAFPSHMILYKEDRAYVHGKIISPI